MKYGRLWLAASATLVLVSLGIIVFRGVDLGIEFVGGTELELRFAETVEVQSIRESLESAGIRNPLVTTLGDESEHEIYIRIGSDGGGAEEQAKLTGLITGTLRGINPDRAVADDSFDLNIIDSDSIATKLQAGGIAAAVQAHTMGEAITRARATKRIFSSFEQLREIEALTPEATAYLESNAQLGPLAVRKQSYVFPAVGAELLRKAEFAILLSLLMMMLYIWLRFHLQWGFAAMVSLAHDTVITLGLFSLFDMELSLPVVAAFLTLVGYSVNDTVVIFDRIRENIRGKIGGSFFDTINLSINQTLGRTIITSGTTWAVVFVLYLYGGSALQAFSFVLTAGLVAGTYSTIFVACPLLLLGARYFPSKVGLSKDGSAVQADGMRRAKKVRTT